LAFQESKQEQDAKYDANTMHEPNQFFSIQGRSLMVIGKRPERVLVELDRIAYPHSAFITLDSDAWTAHEIRGLAFLQETEPLGTVVAVLPPQ
jgi:hypothetical protein